MARSPEFYKLKATRANFLEEVTNYCLLGASDKELGEFFGISEHQVRAWSGSIEEGRYAIEEFADAVNAGRDMADARIARAMFKRAEGYSYQTDRIVMDKGHAVVMQVTEHVPPDTQAGKFWLTNRAKRKWKDKQEHTHSGPDGGALQTELTITFVAPGAPALPPGGGGEMINVTPSTKSPDADAPYDAIT